MDCAIKNADHLKDSNCQCCKNPRRNRWNPAKGKTRKEIQAQKDLKNEKET